MTDIAASITDAPADDVPAGRARSLQRLATFFGVFGIGLAIAIVRLGTAGDERFHIGLDLASLAPILTTVLYPVIGALIIQRRPTTRVAWLMIAIGIGLGSGFALYAYGAVAMPPPPTWPGAIPALVISQFFFVPVLATCTTMFFLIFPTDRLLEPRWRWVVVLAVIGLIAYLLGSVFRPGGLDDANFGDTPNPVGLPADFNALTDALIVAGNAAMLSAVLLAVASLVVRYRNGDATERAQIRWIALVGAFVALSFAVAAFQNDVVSDRAWELGFAFLALMPIAIGFAITRYRLYDIDRLINRTLVYGALTAILAGLFTAGIGLAQRLFIATTGESSDVAIVLTTLVVATAYAPLRRRLEASIDRWFKYEHREFGKYRDELDRILGVLEPTRAAQRLVDEAVSELEATGGAVVDTADAPVAVSGAWPVPAVVRLTIPGNPGGLQAILVGLRRDGRPHDPTTIARMEEIAALVAKAVGLTSRASS